MGLTYRLVIGYNSKQWEQNNFEPDTFLDLDCVDSKNVSESSSIASQPMQSGDTISDHMYRDPVTYSVSGKFSLNGKYWNDKTYNTLIGNNSCDRLSAIQELFKKIKDEGYLCQLMTIQENDDNNTKDSGISRFTIRKNMALTRISWTEYLNQMGFSFEFKEIIFVDQQEYYDSDNDYLGLPKITAPTGTSLSQFLIDGKMSQEVFFEIVKNLYESGYISAAFLEGIKTYGDNAKFWGISSVVVQVAGAIAIAVVAGAALSAAAAGIAVSAAIFPVGTIIAGIAVAAYGIYSAYKCVTNNNKKKEAEKAAKAKSLKIIDLVNGSPEEGFKKLQEIYDSVVDCYSSLEQNVMVYSTNGKNEEQQVYLKINGTIYVLDFTKNNLNDSKWEFRVLDTSGNIISTLKNSSAPYCTQLTEMSLENNTCWFTDKNKKYEVYIFNPSIQADVQELNLTEEKSKEAYKNAEQDISGYTFWVSNGHMQEHVSLISKVIANVLIEKGYV